jgi:hypothetical protein
MNRPFRARVSRCGLALAALAFFWTGCTGIEPELRSLLEQTNPQAGVQEWHDGPAVEVAETGPARFVKALHEGFRPHRARELVSFADRYYRAPANEGYDEVLTRLDSELHDVGFGGADPRLELEFLKVSDLPRAWTPLSASLVLSVEGEEPRSLHAFSDSVDVDRVMLPVNAPACDLEAEVALRLGDIRQGMVLVTDVDAEQVMMRARNAGAVAVVSASLYHFNADKTGANRHHDAIQFTTLPPGTSLPVIQISPRSKEAIEAAVERARKRGTSVKLRIQAEVMIESRPLRTLMAVIRGDTEPDEAVAVVSHVQEPGANDNASGVAGLLEGARALVEALRAEKLPWPDRSLVFLWGDEFRQSESWLASTKMKPVAGISSDMTGQSKETGARALLERNYDPGAVRVLRPDWHTPWGAGQVDPEEILPRANGLAVIARCAMADVALLEGGWTTSEHPWEGGSDHDIFIRRGIPAVLFWHFIDFTYHTSLDRMQFVDPGEMRRTGVALLATALAVASAEPGDLDRYVDSLEKERLLRVDAAMEHEDADQVKRWKDWCDAARMWLRRLCLGEAADAPKK